MGDTVTGRRPVGEAFPASPILSDDGRSKPTSSSRRRRLRRELLTDIIYAGPQYVLYVGLVILPFLSGRVG